MIERTEAITPNRALLTEAQYAALQGDGPATYHIGLERYSLDFNWHPTEWIQSRTTATQPMDAIETGGYVVRVFFESTTLKSERLPSEDTADQSWSSATTIATDVDDTVSPTLVIYGMDNDLACFWRTAAGDICWASSSNHGNTWGTPASLSCNISHVKHLAATYHAGSYPYLHVVSTNTLNETRLYVYEWESGWGYASMEGLWPYPFTGFDAIDLDSEKDLLVASTDLPPLIGMKGEDTTAVRMGYKRQGIIGFVQSRAGWSEYFEIDVLDRARVDYAFRTRPKLFRSHYTDQRIFMVAYGGNGNRWDATRYGTYAWDHLSYYANLLYMTTDGWHWSSPTPINVREDRPDREPPWHFYANPFPEPAVVVNGRYAYLLDFWYCKRAHVTRLLNEWPSSAVVRNAYADVTIAQSNSGAMRQTSLTLGDPDGEIRNSFLLEPGDFITRMFLGRLDANGNPARVLVSTELVDVIEKRIDEQAESSVSVVSRDFLSLLTDRIKSPSSEEFNSQLIGVDLFDDLSHVAAYAGTWDINANGLYHKGDSDRGALHLAWSGVSEVDNFDLSLAFKLNGSETRFQYAGVIFRAHNEVDGSETCYELRYSWIPGVDFSVTITDNLQSLSTAMQSGQLYAANGNAVPDVGDHFRVLGTGDFTGDDLAAAKGSAVSAEDIFMVTNNTPGEESVAFLGSYNDHDSLVLYMIEAGAHTRLVAMRSGVAGWDNWSTNHLYLRLISSNLHVYYKTPATATYTECSITRGLYAADSILTGPEDELSSTPLLSGAVGLSAFGAGHIEFHGLGFVDHRHTITLEDAFRIAGSYGWIPGFYFDDEMKEFPDADGNYDLNEFDGSLPESSTGTWTVGAGLTLQGVGGGSAQWYYRWYDHQLPPSFKLTLTKSGDRGRIIFAAEGSGIDDDYHAFEWAYGEPYGEIALIKNGVDLVRLPMTLPSICDLTLAVREVKMDMTTDTPEWMHITVRVDGKMVLSGASDISGGFPPRYFGFGVYGSDTVHFRAMRIPELTGFVDSLLLDVAGPPFSGIGRLTQGFPIQMHTRFNGKLRVFLPKARSVDATLSTDDVFSLQTAVDRRRLPTHIRMLGAYKELDFYQTDVMVEGWPNNFELLSNPHVITSDDIYAQINALAMLTREEAERATAVIHGNPLLEFGDRVTIMDEGDWLISGLASEIEPATFRQRLEARRYDSRRDS